MSNDEQVCEVIITAPDQAWLVNLTRHLVEARLAACGHHTTIRSIYTWNGAIEDQPETRVALHTRTSCVPAIITITNQQHPYEVPCVVALPISNANPAYRDWILAATDPARTPTDADL